MSWRLALATLLEAAWEVFENTEFVIQRYREETAALGYNGDSAFNSLGDILTCMIGFMLRAARLQTECHRVCGNRDSSFAMD